MGEIKIPIAIKYLVDNCLKSHVSMDSVEESDIEKVMIGFAKLHVKAALKAATEKAKVEVYEVEGFNPVDKTSILTAYPLENIK